MRREKRAVLLKSLILGSGIAILCVFTLFPFYWMTVASLLGQKLMYRVPPVFFPSNPQFTNYVDIFYQKPLLRWILNTLLVAGGVTILSLSVAIFAAYSLSRFRFMGRRFVGQAVLITQMVPATLLLVPLYLIFMQIGLFDTLVSLVLIDVALVVPIAIWILKGFFDTIPIEIEEAAYLDGCGSVRALFRIILPLALPGMLTCVLQSFMVVWHEFLFAVTLTQQESNRVISVGLRYFLNQYVIEWNGIMTASVIGTIPAIIVFLILQRWLVFAFTGGLKG